MTYFPRSRLREIASEDFAASSQRDIDALTAPQAQPMTYTVPDEIPDLFSTGQPKAQAQLMAYSVPDTIPDLFTVPKPAQPFGTSDAGYPGGTWSPTGNESVPIGGMAPVRRMPSSGGQAGQPLEAMSGGYDPGNATRHDKLVRIGHVARSLGLDDEGARILQAVATTEGGLEGAIGDGGKSRGPYQFYEGGQMPNFRRWLAEQGIQGDPNQLVHDVDLATRFAAQTYLGAAIARGRAKGLSGSDLATYVQETGQVSVDPWKTGQNYNALFGQGRDPFAAPASVAQGAPADAVPSAPGPAAGDSAPIGGSPQLGTIKGGISTQDAMAADRGRTMAYQAPYASDESGIIYPGDEPLTGGVNGSGAGRGDAFGGPNGGGLGSPAEVPGRGGDAVPSVGYEGSADGGRYGPGVPYGVADNVEPGDFAIPGRPLAPQTAFTSTQPSDTVESAAASADVTPPSSGDRSDPWSRVTDALKSAVSSLMPQQQSTGLAQAGQDIQRRQATLDDPGGPMPLDEGQPVGDFVRGVAAAPRAISNIMDIPGDIAIETGQKYIRLQQLNAKRIQSTLTPEESEEARTLAIDLSQWANLPSGDIGPRVIVPSFQQEALERLGRRGADLATSPAPGIISRAQADDAGQAFDRYYHGTGSDFARPEPGKFDPNGLFGPGYYVTSDSRVSADYSTARRDPWNRGVADLEALKGKLSDANQSGDYDAALEYRSEIRNLEESLSGANIRPVDVPRDLKLLDADAPITQLDFDNAKAALTFWTGEEPYWRLPTTIENGVTRIEVRGHELRTMVADWLRGHDFSRNVQENTNQILHQIGYDGITHEGGNIRPMVDDAGNAINHRVAVIFPESLDKIRNATAGTPGGFLPGETPREATAAAIGRTVGTGVGAAYEESQREGSTPESVARAGIGGAASGVLNEGLRRTAGVSTAGRISRAVQKAGDDPRVTTAFDPRDPNETYTLRHRVVDLADLVTSHTDDFKPNQAFPSDLQPRLRERAASQAQVNRIAQRLNPDAMIFDARSITSGSPIVNADNIVESGNGRVMGLRLAAQKNPEGWQRYREELAKSASTYGIDPSELQGKKHPVLVRELLDDVDPVTFTRAANKDVVARSSGYENAISDARLLTDDIVQGIAVSDTQSIDQAIQAAGNREALRRFVKALPENEADTMVDEAGMLSEEGLQRFKSALLVKAYGGGGAGQRMARVMIESIDPGVKNLETAIYGSLPQMARTEALAKGTDLSIAQDVAKATEMYARLKMENIAVSDYLSQMSMWERETTPAQDMLIKAFEDNKRSSKRLRDVLEGYAARAEPQANTDQVDMFGAAVARPKKEDLLAGSIRDFGQAGEEVPGAAVPPSGAGLDSGQPRQRIGTVERATSGEAEGLLTPAGAPSQPPPAPPAGVAADTPPPRPVPPFSGGLYVGDARRRTQKAISDALARGEPITLNSEDEIARLRLDKFPEAIREDLAEAAQNAEWFRTQRRGVVSDEAVQAASERTFASIDDVIKRGAAGRAYNPEETVAMRNLLAGQAELVQSYAGRLSGELTKPERARLVAEQLAEAQKLTGLFEVVEGARAEAGRTLRQYREFARSLQDNPTEAGLRYIKGRFGSMEKAEEAVDEYVRLVQSGASPVELASFLRSVKPGWQNRLNILRYGSMLSATTTHLTNALGGVIGLSLDAGLRPVAAGIDVVRAGVTGGPRTRYMGESSEMMRGMLEGTMVGLRDAGTTLWHGINPNDVSKIDNIRGGFGSGSRVVDAVAEGPLRALGAADAFFTAMSLGGHVRAVAYRKATIEGLSGTARAARVQDITEHLYRHLDVLDEASGQARRAVLQEDRAAVRGIMAAREGINNAAHMPLGDIILPFIKTPINIVAQGMEMTPLGVASVIKDARAGRVGDATDTAARALFGTALMAGAGSMAMNGMMTGGYPEDAKARSTLPPGWQPYSVKIGDRYFSYGNLGPIGIPLSAAVIMAEAQKQGKPIASGETVMKLGKYMGDQTFMRGLSDFVKAFNDPTRYGENVVENLATQFTPYAALGRQVQRAMGMAQKDPHGAMDALLATYPMTAGQVADRTDSRGRTVMPSQTGVEAFVSPVRVSREEPDQVLAVLRKAGIGIGAPPKTLVTADGRSVTLTPKQQQQFKQLLYSEIQQNIIDFNDPAEAERAMGRARARARDSLLLAVR